MITEKTYKPMNGWFPLFVTIGKIVEGAVGMVEMALDDLSKKNIIDLDDERRAAMVSNLLVVLCSDRHTQPVVNTGSLYT